MDSEKEPLIGEEQGVVYLFSRYWNKIKDLKNISKLLKVGSRFPDCTYIDNDGNIGGIEFEYYLSGFRKHLTGKKGRKIKRNAVYEFYNNVELPPKKGKFIVVYWYEDDEIQDLQNLFKKSSGKTFMNVNLSKYFQPIIKKSEKNIEAYWSLKINKDIKLEKINEDLQIEEIINKSKQNIEVIFPSKIKNNDVIKIMGFNPKGANDVDYSHWKYINFFTTNSRISSKNPPKYIFIKPKGARVIAAGFKVKKIFVIKSNISKKTKNQLAIFFKNNYFWPFEERYIESNCVIYNNFKYIPYHKENSIFKTRIEKHWSSSGYIVKKENSQLYKKLISLIK